MHPQAPIPYPTAIFIREKALVINVESIRMIICADQILVLSVPDLHHPNTGILPPLRHPFVKELVSRSPHDLLPLFCFGTSAVPACEKCLDQYESQPASHQVRTCQNPYFSYKPHMLQMPLYSMQRPVVGLNRHGMSQSRISHISVLYQSSISHSSYTPTQDGVLPGRQRRPGTPL